jgi:pseudaminic acid biosynthesis-associated methylase
VTKNEEFWAGEFGRSYTERNQVDAQQRVPFFSDVLEPDVQSVCELGANRGHNLRALQSIRRLELTGVEINPAAFEELKSIKDVAAHQSSILAFDPGRLFDFVFTSGVLIHIAPDDLPATYRKLAQLSQRYVLLNEYFNPTPVEVSYRGHAGKLFKRDFAGEFLDTCPGFQVLRYGFLWKRMEPAWDNSTWTLLCRDHV